MLLESSRKKKKKKKEEYRQIAREWGGRKKSYERKSSGSFWQSITKQMMWEEESEKDRSKEDVEKSQRLEGIPIESVDTSVERRSLARVASSVDPLHPSRRRRRRRRRGRGSRPSLALRPHSMLLSSDVRPNVKGSCSRAPPTLSYFPLYTRFMPRWSRLY